jgi:hypothetical protein
MIRYKITRPTADGPERTYESKTLSSLPGNLTQYWVVAAFENREKLADLLVVDDNTLVSGPTWEIRKLAALIWIEQWQVIEQRHVEDGRMWIFKLQRGSDKISLSILLTTTFRVDGADIVPLEPEMFQTSPLEKEHWLSAVKLARQLNPSINTEEGQLRCRLEQVEGEIELLSDEKIALIEAIARCGVVRSGAALSKP